MKIPKSYVELLEEFGDPRISFHEWKTNPEGCAYGKQYIVRVNIKGLNKSYPCHIKLADLFEKINEQAYNNGDLISCGGIYVPRLKRWAEKQWGSWADPQNIPINALSMHSWGIAEDCNVATNAYGKTGSQPASLLTLFRANGFAWGGDFAHPDPMHFQYASLYL